MNQVTFFRCARCATVFEKSPKLLNNNIQSGGAKRVLENTPKMYPPELHPGPTIRPQKGQLDPPISDESGKWKVAQRPNMFCCGIGNNVIYQQD